jgi:hypothetical protein
MRNTFSGWALKQRDGSFVPLPRRESSSRMVDIASVCSLLQMAATGERYCDGVLVLQHALL